MTKVVGIGSHPKVASTVQHKAAALLLNGTANVVYVQGWIVSRLSETPDVGDIQVGFSHVYQPTTPIQDFIGLVLASMVKLGDIEQLDPFLELPGQLIAQLIMTKRAEWSRSDSPTYSFTAEYYRDDSVLYLGLAIQSDPQILYLYRFQKLGDFFIMG